MHLQLIDVLNDDGTRTGEILAREEVHLLGKLHRAVHLYLFDTKGNLLLQKRSDTVDHYPGVFSISLTGHVDAGECSSDALHREIQEELGLDPREMKLRFLFSYRQDVVVREDYIDRQLNDVYVCFHDFVLENVQYDKHEVKELKLVPFSTFQSMTEDQNTLLAKLYGKAYRDIVYFLSGECKVGR